MISFVIEARDKTEKAVTGTYMKLLWEAFAQTGTSLQSIAKGEEAASKNAYIVTDTIQTAFQYMCKGYHNHIVWMQGVVPEESFMRRHSKLRFWAISFLEYLVLKKAKMLLLVSNEMLQHYEKKYHLNLKRKSFIMPCFNEMSIENTAFLNDKYKENTFTYVGSLHAWQCFEETVKLYAQIEKKANKPVQFYVYTFQQEAAENVLQKYDVQNYTVDCVPQEELSEQIKKIKYGFIIREDCAVNNVATPTKFSNYLANGIIPIYSSALKSFATFDQENQCGIIYDLDEPEEGLNRILDHMQLDISADQVRQKCENVFATYYNSAIYRDKLAIKIKSILK